MEYIIIIAVTAVLAAGYVLYKRHDPAESYDPTDDDIISDDTDIGGSSRHGIYLTLVNADNYKIRYNSVIDKIDGSSIVIGRSRECNVIISNDMSVSSKHCSITYYDGILLIEDLHSRNKTILNNRQIIDPQKINPGDRIKLGDVSLIISFSISG